MILEAIASATLANQDIGGGYVTAFSGTLAGTDNRNVIATTRITGRDGGSSVDISFRVTVGSLLKADETIEYIGTAGAAIELQSFPFRWGAGQTLTIQLQSSDPLDSDCGLQVLIEADDPSAIANAVWDEPLTGATHNVATSAGRRLRTLADTVVLNEGDVISADNNGVINGENGLGRVQFASDVGTVCVGQAVRVSGQVRYVELYDQPTQTATVDAPWCVVPTVGDEYTIFSQRSSLVMRINAAASGTIAFVIAKLWEMIEDASGWRWTAASLSQAPQPTAEVIHVPTPNVNGNLVLTQGDTYDGIGNPKAQWSVEQDYTSGWSVTLTIRDKDDAVIYTTAGEVVSDELVAVTIETPTGLTMEGCPGQWQGKFDVEMTKDSSVQTIAVGVCYINEDQTR